MDGNVPKLASIAALVAILLLAHPPSVASAAGGDGEHYPPATKLSPALLPLIKGEEAPEGIATIGDLVRVRVITDVVGAELLNDFGRVIFKLPARGSTVVALMLVEKEKLADLAALSGVRYVLPDVKVHYEPLPKILPDIAGGEIGVDMFKIREILGVNAVNSTFGLQGEGIVIAVVDTGVDYGHPDLRDALPFDEDGVPLVLDADAAGLIYPFYDVPIVNGTLPVAGQTFLSFSTLGYWLGVAEGYPLGFFSITLPSDLNVTGIQSASGVVKLGISAYFIFFAGGSYFGNFIFVPVIYVDSVEPGVYDTVYIDLSTAYAMVFGGELDWSFADEEPLKLGDVAVRDFTGDGIPDISMGVVGGYFLDWMGYFGGGFKVGFTTTGEYLLLFHDFYMHGTACAGNIAARGVMEFDVGLDEPVKIYGVAPKSKILGVVGLWNGFVEAGWLFAAGFDIAEDGTVYYTGKVRAPVVSNSWGISYHMYDRFAFGYDFESIFENAIALPGFLDPAYPGVLMVHAAGNGGPGYGTVTSSGAASLALTVGASTSMHWAYLQAAYFLDGYEGHFDDVISWSARGPVPIGEVKPDVLNIGAFGFDITSLWDGGPDGRYAWTIFGGTSMATPLTAGVAALVIEAALNAGVEPSPILVKNVIMASAADVNCEPWVQGAGRVDAYKAVSFFVEGDAALPVILIESTDTVARIADITEAAWNAVFGVGMPIPKDGLPTASVFAGRLLPGESVELSFAATAKHFTGMVSLSAITFEKSGTIALEGSLNETDFLTYFVFDPAELADADLIEFNAYMPFTLFDPELDYVWNHRIGIVFSEWIDDGDGELEAGELARFNYGYIRGIPVSMFVNNPVARMYDVSNKLVLLVYRGDQAKPVPLNFTVLVTKYKKVGWGWLSLPESIAVEPGTATTFTATLTVPVDAAPGYHAAFIIASFGATTMRIPISVVVPTTETEIGSGSVEWPTPYNNFAVKGGFNWRWRYEAGDWRFFAFKTDVKFIDAIIVTVEWQNPETCIDVFVLSPDGMFVGTTDLGTYIGSGRFLWHSTEPEPTKNTAYAAASFWSVPNDGIYTIFIHNVLYAGAIPVEPFTIKIKVIPSAMTAAPVGPLQFVMNNITVSSSYSDPLFLPEVSVFAGKGVEVIAYGPTVLPRLLLHDVELFAVARVSGEAAGTYHAAVTLKGIRVYPFYVKYRWATYLYMGFWLWSQNAAVEMSAS